MGAGLVFLLQWTPMSWALKRKILYILLVIAAVLALALPVVYFLIPNPTCFDGKQNQDEQGIDCDGSCAKVCLERTGGLQVLWTRSFQVSEKVFSAVAYVSNPNVSLGAYEVPYTFRLYDAKNILVGERHGVATLPPNTTFPIFEGVITTGSRPPARTFFEFAAKPVFERLPDQPGLLIKNQEFSDEDGTPRLTATIANQNIFSIRNITVDAILYDLNDNAIAASETVIDEIPKDDSREVVFTWPQPFGKPVNRIEIYPKFIYQGL